MKETSRKTSRARLARIEGQVRAIGTMIDIASMSSASFGQQVPRSPA